MKIIVEQLVNKLNKMKVTNFPDCCGIDILSSFGNTNTAINRTEYTREEVREFLKESAKNEVFGWSKQNAFEIVTLNGDQFDKIGDVFIDEGFEVVGKNEHIKHNSIIYILIKSFKYGAAKSNLESTNTTSNRNSD